MFHRLSPYCPKRYDLALKLRNEYVIEVKGIVIERESKNLNIKTGEIEVDVSEVTTEDDDIRAVSLNIPSNVEAVDFDPDRVIVSVTIPRAVVEETEEEVVDPAEVPSDNGGEKTESTEE